MEQVYSQVDIRGLLNLWGNTYFSISTAKERKTEFYSDGVASTYGRFGYAEHMRSRICEMRNNYHRNSTMRIKKWNIEYF